jgi:hypothetical protein
LPGSSSPHDLLVGLSQWWQWRREPTGGCRAGVAGTAASGRDLARRRVRGSAFRDLPPKLAGTQNLKAFLVPAFLHLGFISFEGLQRYVVAASAHLALRKGQFASGVAEKGFGSRRGRPPPEPPQRRSASTASGRGRFAITSRSPALRSHRHREHAAGGEPLAPPDRYPTPNASAASKSAVTAQ